MSRDVILTCAVTGASQSFKINPAVPITPENIARECLEAASAGAAVVHIHVRNPETGEPSMELDQYREVFERIREKNEDVLINLTTGVGAQFDPGEVEPAIGAETSNFQLPEARVRHIQELRPDICSLDIGTLNFPFTVFINTGDHVEKIAQYAREIGVKPELEVFDLGHVRQAADIVAREKVDQPPLFQLCMGVRWGAPATIDALLAMQRTLPENAVWAAFGVSHHQRPVAAMATLLGGNVRVGLEDNVYLERGVLAPGNAALVEQGVAIINALGQNVASPDRAREIYGIEKK